MILLGKEQPIGLETQEVFNPTTVNMVLQAQQNYINAMRDDYLRSQEEMKEFKKQYGDFYSPLSKDNLNWYNITQKPIQDLMKIMGPDMLRSQEGRAMISQVLNNVDYGALAKLKASAQDALSYQKALGDLTAKGLYSKDFQHWVNQQKGINDFENWDTLNDGVFAQTSPDIYQDLNAVTSKWYDNAEPLYKGMENGNRVYSLDMGDLKNIAQTNAQGFINTPRGAYEFDQIKRQLRNADPYISETDLTNKAYDVLNDRVANANIERLRAKKYEADDFALAKYKNDLEIAAAKAIAKTKSSGSGSGDDDKNYNIFYDSLHFPYSSVSYNPQLSNQLRIQPKHGSYVKTNYDDNGNVLNYQISGNRLQSVLFHESSINSKSTPVGLRGTFKKNREYVFVPDGQFKVKDHDGAHHYYIQGRVGFNAVAKDEKGNIIYNEDGTPSYTKKFIETNGNNTHVYMEVTEALHSYNKKNTSDVMTTSATFAPVKTKKDESKSKKK